MFKVPLRLSHWYNYYIVWKTTVNFDSNNQLLIPSTTSTSTPTTLSRTVSHSYALETLRWGIQSPFKSFPLTPDNSLHSFISSSTTKKSAPSPRREKPSPLVLEYWDPRKVLSLQRGVIVRHLFLIRASQQFSPTTRSEYKRPHKQQIPSSSVPLGWKVYFNLPSIPRLLQCICVLNHVKNEMTLIMRAVSSSSGALTQTNSTSNSNIS